jgi:hypothetical protein
MNERARLISHLGVERERFEERIQQVRQNDLIELEIVEKWTIKDILAHITAWEIELMRWLDSARRGQPPAIPAPGQWSEYIERFNRQTYEENKARSLEDVLLSFEQVYMGFTGYLS